MYTDRYIVSHVLWSYSLLFTVAMALLNKLSLQRMRLFVRVSLNQVCHLIWTSWLLQWFHMNLLHWKA